MPCFFVLKCALLIFSHKFDIISLMEQSFTRGVLLPAGLYLVSRKRILFIFLLFVLSFNLKAESVFSLDLKTEIIIYTVAIGTVISSFFLETLPSHIPESLSKSALNFIDRSMLVTRLNSTVRYISSAAMVGINLLPVLPILPTFDNFSLETVVTYGVMYSQAVLLAYGTRSLMKNNITRFRPWYYGDSVPGPDSRHDSFPSGHTTSAFLAATFLSTTFSLEHPESRWRWPIVFGSHAMAAGIGALRIVSGMHFFTDVVAGAAIGSLYGWLIPTLHRNNRQNGFMLKPVENSWVVSLRI